MHQSFLIQKFIFLQLSIGIDNYTFPFSILSMLRQSTSSFIKRQVKTSEPRFKRLNRAVTPQSEAKITPHRHFPSLNKGNAFDNSKENLYYQTHLTKVRSACRLDQTAIVSKYLNTIRKDYDEMSKVGRSELTTVQLKKRQIEFMRQKNKVFQERRQAVQKLIQAKELETAQVRIRCGNERMQTKTLEHIIARMKKDEIFYKQFGRVRDEELKRKLKENKALDENMIHWEEKVHKAMEMLQDCKALYYKNSDMRGKKFDDYAENIDGVKERDRFIEERKERTYELQSIELNDTLDEKNIHMREIILADRVAESLLQSKVNNLIKQYADTQAAFHIVKVKTGVTEPQLLTSKFFSYQQTAEGLLESITFNEQRLQQLTSRRAKLQQEHRDIINEALVVTDAKEPVKTGQSELNQKKEHFLKDINDKKLLIDKIATWIEKRLHDFNPEKAEEQNDTFEVKFKHLCESIAEHSKKYQNYNMGDKKVPIGGIRLKKLVKELSAEEISARIRETQEMNESNIMEEEFLQTSRQSVLRKGFNIKHLKRDSNQK